MDSQLNQQPEQSKSEIFSLKCAFCGSINCFSKDELYDTAQKGEKLKEKFCIFCGEPLIVKCGICNTTFYLFDNLQNHPIIKVASSFWAPEKSKIDELLPEIRDKFFDYQNFARKNLKEQDFILRQKEFLENLAPLKKKIQSLRFSISNLANLENLSQFSKDFSSVLKNIDKINAEIEDIVRNIEPVKNRDLEGNNDPENNAVNEKKAKQLKKHVIFLDIVPEIEKILLNVQELRDLEIIKEKEGLNPGYKKIFSHLTYDPSFYRIICPNCNTPTFYIQKQLYRLNQAQNQLQYIEQLPILSDENQQDSSGLIYLTLIVHIHLEIPQTYDLNGRFRLILDPNTEEIIGRNFLREIDYEEPISDKVLYDNKDPLGRISSKQFSLKVQNNGVVLQAMQYDARRVGTFLNDFTTDIRTAFPDGVTLHTGDKILIPLINEPNNPNIASITFEISN
ncbi:MAG: hypothetical protein DRO88_03725 [Promethearchaeia archaeon]|nr:MAG: hypothetical protein DRO88_03725 [Candidatus Lokiarchaeia archaeon]